MTSYAIRQIIVMMVLNFVAMLVLPPYAFLVVNIGAAGYNNVRQIIFLHKFHSGALT